MKVALKAPRLVAITFFVRATLDETVTTTTSLARNPVPWMITGERETTLTWAARVDAPAVTGSNAATSADSSTSFTPVLYPTPTHLNLE